MTAKRQTKFERDCLAVSERTGVDVFFLYDMPMDSDCYEDDGVLHIRKRGVQAVFGVSPGDHHDETGAVQNANTRKVLEALGMSKKITERVLVEEDEDDEEECCESCGRPW